MSTTHVLSSESMMYTCTHPHLVMHMLLCLGVLTADPALGASGPITTIGAAATGRNSASNIGASFVVMVASLVASMLL